MLLANILEKTIYSYFLSGKLVNARLYNRDFYSDKPEDALREPPNSLTIEITFSDHFILQHTLQHSYTYIYSY